MTLSLFFGALALAVVQRWPIAPAAWAALILLLHATRGLSASAGLAAVAAAIYLAVIAGNRGVIPIPGVPYYFFAIAITLTMWLPFAVDRLVGPRVSGVSRSLVFALAWVSIEFLRSRVTPSSTWGSIAYTQSSYVALMQLASLTGIWGVSFLVSWGASAIELAWGGRSEGPSASVPAVIAVSALLLALIGGTTRLVMAPTDRPTVRVATVNRPTDVFAPGELTRLASGDVGPEGREPLLEKLTRLHDWFVEHTRREASAGARLVAWPEVALVLLAEQESQFLVRAQRLAAEQRIFLAMGINTVHLGERPPSENKLVVVDPQGRIIINYEKSHPVAGWEAGVIRVGAPIVPIAVTEYGRLAGVICNDGTFPEFVRQAGSGLADLLIEPANDWREVKTVHFQMDQMRAIENGLPILRPASSGLSGAFDPWGRVLASADFFSDGERSVVVQLPIGRIPTLYSRIGDAFAWVCVVGLFVVIAFGLTKSG